MALEENTQVDNLWRYRPAWFYQLAQMMMCRQTVVMVSDSRLGHSTHMHPLEAIEL